MGVITKDILVDALCGNFMSHMWEYNARKKKYERMGIWSSLSQIDYGWYRYALHKLTSRQLLAIYKEVTGRI